MANMGMHCEAQFCTISGSVLKTNLSLIGQQKVLTKRTHQIKHSHHIYTLRPRSDRVLFCNCFQWQWSFLLAVFCFMRLMFWHERSEHPIGWFERWLPSNNKKKNKKKTFSAKKAGQCTSHFASCKNRCLIGAEVGFRTAASALKKKKDHCPGSFVFWNKKPTTHILNVLDKNGHFSFFCPLIKKMFYNRLSAKILVKRDTY